MGKPLARQPDVFVGEFVSSLVAEGVQTTQDLNEQTVHRLSGFEPAESAPSHLKTQANKAALLPRQNPTLDDRRGESQLGCHPIPTLPGPSKDGCDVCADRPERLGQRIGALSEIYLRLPRAGSGTVVSPVDSISGKSVSAWGDAHVVLDKPISLNTQMMFLKNCDADNIYRSETQYLQGSTLAPWYEPETIKIGLMQVAEECEEEIYIIKDEGMEDPPQSEKEAIIKAVKENFETLMKPGRPRWIRGNLPGGEVRWYHWEPSIKIGCKGVISIRLSKRGPSLPPENYKVIEVDATGQPDDGTDTPSAEPPAQPSSEPAPSAPEHTCLSYTPDRELKTTHWRARDGTVQQPKEGTPIWKTATWDEFVAGELYTPDRIKQLRKTQDDCESSGGVFILEVVDHSGKPLTENANLDVEGAGVQVVCYKCYGTCPENRRCITKQRLDDEGNTTGAVYCDCV
jgi:hypothetical protein